MPQTKLCGCFSRSSQDLEFKSKLQGLSLRGFYTIFHNLKGRVIWRPEASQITVAQV